MGRGGVWFGAVMPAAVAAALVVAGVGAGLAQEAATPAAVEPAAEGRLALIRAGTCGDREPGEVVAELSAVTPAEGERLGQAAGITAETSYSTVPLVLDELLADDSKLEVVGADGETTLACGEIGGRLDETGSLQIGLRAVGGSGLVGIAYLAADEDGVSTDISLFVAAGLAGDSPAGDDRAAATPVATVEAAEDEEELDGPVAGATPADDAAGAAAEDVAATATAEAAAEAAAEATAEADAEATAEAGATATALAERTEVVDVSLTEFAIDLPTTLPAGRVLFDITNDGAVAHSFVIAGEGIEEGLGERLQSGESVSLAVELAPGTYQIYCPVGNHADQGMFLEITVE